MITGSNPIVDTMNATQPATAAAPSSQVDKTTFLKLLVMQLRYQDPTNPMSSENFMGQVAQFNELEQAMNLNEQFENFASYQALTQASSLIGKDVQAISSDGDTTGLVSGTVQEVILLDKTPILKLSSGAEVPIQMVVTVK